MGPCAALRCDVGWPGDPPAHPGAGRRLCGVRPGRGHGTRRRRDRTRVFDRRCLHAPDPARHQAGLRIDAGITYWRARESRWWSAREERRRSTAARRRRAGHRRARADFSHARRGAGALDDLTVGEAIADEAAVAVARAGLFEEKAVHATTDPLTKVGNRRAFEERLGEATGATAVIAIDVDHLKPINDEFGHEAGDMLLIEVARTLRTLLRAGDQLLRIGGDEFVSIMDATTEAEAVAIAERMRVSLHGVALPHGRARISAGVAAGGGGVHALWLAADEA